ncbi:MAG TPA: amidase, partial [Thermoanaerobaculia bacterium]|nr:amidase [Thermoanaerobaculia bacterium]
KPSTSELALSRRQLLGGLAAGLAASALVPPGRAEAASAPASASGPAAGAAPFSFEEATVADLQRHMEQGSQTARSIAAAYLDRIERLDRSGPRLSSVIEVNPDALQIADALDKERKEKGPRGPLHGIPVLIKDNIDTADRMKTTAGSLALDSPQSPRPSRDAFLVERLRAAGAVILGKTNLSEWANFRSTRSTSGWSGRGGQTRNPYALDRSPSGSSSGTGAAIAASFAAVGVGTETDGSVVSPSSVQGLVGIKPTVGLVSRAGVIPIAASQDTAGPMCRTVTDAAILLTALAGKDPRDPATAAAEGITDYAQGLDPKALDGARIGVVRSQGFGKNPAVDAIFDGAVAAIKKLGATVLDPVDLAWSKEIDDAEYEVLLYEFKDGLERYLAERGGPMRNLADLIAWNEAHRDRESPWFGQEIFHAAAAKGPLTDEAYTKARQVCIDGARTKGIEATLAADRLDAIVTSTNGFAWLIDWANGDAYTGGSSSLAAVAATPSITVPAGFAFGLPVGISFSGPVWSEAKLIRFAYAFEQGTKARRPPTFAPGAAFSSDRMPEPSTAPTAAAKKA